MTESDSFLHQHLFQDILVSNLTNYRNVLAVLGLLYATKVSVSSLVRLLRVFRTYVLPRFWYDRDFRKYGSWAVVTGASEGIGRSYALCLAERQMNVFLISRNKGKLQAVAQEIEKKGVAAGYMAMDLKDLSKEECSRMLQERLSGLDVGILVNNVGYMFDKLQYFLNVPSSRILDLIDLNITATSLMTHMILPGMVTRKRGAIINIGSGSAVKPTPLMSLYSASKVFVDQFSRVLDFEYSSNNIIVQVVHPFYVSTNLTHNAKVNIIMQSADSFVNHSIRTLGVSKRCYGTAIHGFMGWIGEMIPEKLYMYLAVYINGPLYLWLCGHGNESSKTK